MKITYSSNNSGGDWWLTDDDWHKLEAAGWSVEWKKDSDSDFVRQMLKDGRYLGALATSAAKDFPSEKMAIAEWEHVTGQSADEVGCTCCGQPHNFY